MLETIIDLVSVIRRHLLVDGDELVKVADAAMLIIACLVDPMALFTLLLAFGALFRQVLLEVLAWHFDQVACVTGDELVWTIAEMVI